jgi:putative Mg2+ transporter-C (MgtC) family protein
MKIIFLKLLLSFFLGGLIGIERGFKGKAAGFRTMILICYGSTLLTIISYELVKVGSHFLGDPSRIAANIITGIGFLGAGTIMKLKGGEIHGLTTAATLWVTASIGITIGAGYYIVAVVSTFFIVIILTLLKSIEAKIEMVEKKYKLSVKSTFPLENNDILEKFKIDEKSIINFSHGKIDTIYYWDFMFSSEEFDRDSIISRAYSLEGVKEFKLEELDA